MPDRVTVDDAEHVANLRAALDLLPECLVQLAAVRSDSGEIVDFQYLEANQAACIYNRMPRGELVGMLLSDVQPGLAEDGIVEKFINVVETGVPWIADDLVVENPILGRTTRTDSRTVRLGDGLLVMWRDVTDLHETARALALSEERYRLLADNASDLVLHMRGPQVAWASPSVLRLLGWRDHEIVGKRLETIVHPEDQTQLQHQGVMSDGGQTSRGRARLLDAEGGYHWFDVHGGPFLTSDGKRDGHIAAFRMIEAEVVAERLLDRRARYDTLTGLMNRHEILEQMAAIGEGSRRSGEATAVLFCDLDKFKDVNDSHGHAAGDEVLRVTADRIKQCVRSTDFVARIGGDEMLVVLNGVRDLDDALSIAEKIRVTAGYPIPVQGDFVGITLSIGVAIAGPGESVDRIMERADMAMYQAKQKGRDQVIHASLQPSVGRVLVVDDDEFLLMIVAELLAQMGISEVLTARNGEEALAIVDDPASTPDVIVSDLGMPEIDGIELLRHLTDRRYPGGLVMMSGTGVDLLGSVRDLVRSHGLTLLGVLPKPIDPAELLRALENADPAPVAMAPVVAPRDPRMGLLTPEEVRAGIRDGHVDIYVQPKVTVFGRKVVSAEALLRWRDPVRGVLSPLAVVPVAEEHGLIDELTRAVYRKAVSCLATWQRLGHEMRISVNLSTQNLGDLGLPDLLAAIAKEGGVSPDSIILEITESHLLEDLAASMEVIGRLRLKGFGVSVDDYGMGYSNLRKLKQLPITELKVDRSFVEGADRDKHLRAILGSSVALGHSLGVSVVAEGVESPEVWAILEELGCDEVQGFIVSTPMPAEDFTQWKAGWDSVWQS